MVKFRTNIDNDEYITIDKTNLMMLVVMDETPQEIKDVANDIFVETLYFQKNNRITYISEVELRKDSLMGKYLLENGISKKIRNDDLYVYYNDVINSYNIASFERNSVMHLLLCMLRERVEGYTFDLSKKFGNDVIDYISNNKDFNVYLEKLDGTYKTKELLMSVGTGGQCSPVNPAILVVSEKCRISPMALIRRIAIPVFAALIAGALFASTWFAV